MVAAWLFVGLSALLVVFQIALALGAPLGHFAWGGQHRVLPRKLRITSLIAVPIYAVFAGIMLLRAGVAPGSDGGWTGPAAWCLVAYFALGVLMNGISRSRPEQLTMTPVALAFTGLATLVALG